MAQTYNDLTELTPEESARLFSGQEIADSEEQEMKEVFDELAVFMSTVYHGGSWPHDRVFIAMKRARNLVGDRWLELESTHNTEGA